MAAFVSDTFTEASDTFLRLHSPEVGGAWIAMTAISTELNVIAAEDRVGGSSPSATGFHRNNATPPSADYFVQGTVRWTVVNDVSQLPGLCIRFSSSATTCYYSRYLGNATVGTRQWQLRKFVAGVDSAIGSYVEDLPINTDFVCKLSAVGSTIKLFVDGVERISVTDTDISDAGFPGLCTRQNGRVDTFTADVEAAGGATVNLGLATETETVFGLSLSKKRTLGLATETDTAPGALTLSKKRTLGLATEVESAFAMTVTGGAAPDEPDLVEIDGMLVNVNRLMNR